MKLLLTSAGITNKTIINALAKMVIKPFDKLKLAFIPTAANFESGDKWWLIKDYKNFQNLKFAQFDIVDISAISKNVWMSRLREADILVFGGGNTYHLMYWVEKSGLKNVLTYFLKRKIYVGISAGSVITTKNFIPIFNDAAFLYAEKNGEKNIKEGLGYIDFQIRPHYNSPQFPNVTDKNIKVLGEKIKEPIYAIDDQTAIVISGDKMEIVTEGKWSKFY